ncbi:MAG: CC/Se motif family (seleno)protein [Tissierellia bacterium]|nr:CC/Se motif family (seleno)protein [Tissierellia bacterium]
MKLNIEQKALDYCKEKNIDTITVSVVVAGSCGGGGVNEPVVNKGEPQDRRVSYQRLEQEGLNIYIPEYIVESDQNLTLTVKKYLMVKNLAIEGLETKL